MLKSDPSYNDIRCQGHHVNPIKKHPDKNKGDKSISEAVKGEHIESFDIECELLQMTVNPKFETEKVC